VKYKPYVLYLISINIDYLDINSNETRHVESDQFSLIDVEHGNSGGCLNIKRWFSSDLERNPPSKSYDDGIPFDVYQLLTADFSRDPGILNVFLNNRNLVSRTSEVKKAVDSRPGNSVFSANYEEWTRTLDRIAKSRPRF
jgi:hypothetical protein